MVNLDLIFTRLLLAQLDVRFKFDFIEMLLGFDLDWLKPADGKMPRESTTRAWAVLAPLYHDARITSVATRVTILRCPLAFLSFFLFFFLLLFLSFGSLFYYYLERPLHYHSSHVGVIHFGFVPSKYSECLLQWIDFSWRIIMTSEFYVKFFFYFHLKLCEVISNN